ncbi:hypothetical protein [Hyphococcus sp.]|uniref:hypothetical protein n=1 Tax=Hyphococcus sp. TaxID=2038636 RepID=UPI003CCBBC7F
MSTTNMKSALDVNGLFIPHLHLFKALRQYVSPVYFSNDEVEAAPRFAAIGSSINLHYRSRFFQVTCRHVAEDQTRDYFSIGQNYYDPALGWRFQSTKRIYGKGDTPRKVDTPGEDMLIAEFEELPEAAKRNFLKIEDNFFMDEGNQRQVRTVECFIVGFPSQSVMPEWGEVSDDKLELLSWKLAPAFKGDAFYRDRDGFDDDQLIPMELPDGFGEIDPNGLSGCPCFHVYVLNDGRFRFGLNGIVVAANRELGKIGLLPARALRLRFEDLFAK